MKHLILIRHGKTAANEAHQYCGSSDLPLSENGRAGLRPLQLPLENVKFFTSSMKRTDETLQLLFGNVPFTPLPRFREVDFGIFELHTYDELKDTPAYQAWLQGDNMKNTPPGGESGEAFTKRILAALSELLAEPADSVLVTHGGVIAAIMEHLFPEENKNRYQWQPIPGKGYLLSLTEHTYQNI